MSTQCRHCNEYRDLALFSNNQLKKNKPKCWFCVEQKTVEALRNDLEAKEGTWGGEGNKRRRIADSNELFYCVGCAKNKPAVSFSNRQLDSRHCTLPRCRTCVTAAVLEKEATDATEKLEKEATDATSHSSSDTSPLASTHAGLHDGRHLRPASPAVSEGSNATVVDPDLQVYIYIYICITIYIYYI
jgi:hypothetical protein